MDKHRCSWQREGGEKRDMELISVLCAEKIATAVTLQARVTQQTGKSETTFFSKLQQEAAPHGEQDADPLTGVQRKLNGSDKNAKV